MSITPSGQLRGLLTVDQAAEYLGLAPSTIRAWVYKGKLAHLKLGKGRWAPLRFRYEDLEAYLEEHWYSKRY